jgi:hypothetical protein
LSLLKHVLSLFKTWYLIFRVGKELNSPPLLHERTHAHCTLPPLPSLSLISQERQSYT